MIRIFAHTLVWLMVLLSGAEASCVKFFLTEGHWEARNGCQERVYVEWKDQGSCRTGCGARLGPGEAQAVNGMDGYFTYSDRPD